MDLVQNGGSMDPGSMFCPHQLTSSCYMYFTQHHAEVFLGAMDTTFLLAYAVVRITLCAFQIFKICD